MVEFIKFILNIAINSYQCRISNLFNRAKTILLELINFILNIAIICYQFRLTKIFLRKCSNGSMSMIPHEGFYYPNFILYTTARLLPPFGNIQQFQK